MKVHGPRHAAEGPTRRHVNVSVKRTDCTPVGLSLDAGARVRGREPLKRTSGWDAPENGLTTNDRPGSTEPDVQHNAPTIAVATGE